MSDYTGISTNDLSRSASDNEKSNPNCTKNYMKGLNTLSKSLKTTDEFICLYKKSISSFMQANLPSSDVYNLYEICKHCIIDSCIPKLCYVPICRHIIDELFNCVDSTTSTLACGDGHPYAVQLISLISNILQHKCDARSINCCSSEIDTHMELVRYMTQHNRGYHKKWIVALITMLSDCCISFEECHLVCESLVPYVSCFVDNGSPSENAEWRSGHQVMFEDFSILYYHMVNMGKISYQQHSKKRGSGGSGAWDYDHYVSKNIVRVCTCLESLIESIPHSSSFGANDSFTRGLSNISNSNTANSSVQLSNNYFNTVGTIFQSILLCMQKDHVCIQTLIQFLRSFSMESGSNIPTTATTVDVELSEDASDGESSRANIGFNSLLVDKHVTDSIADCKDAANPHCSTTTNGVSHMFPTQAGLDTGFSGYPPTVTVGTLSGNTGVSTASRAAPTSTAITMLSPVYMYLLLLLSANVTNIELSVLHMFQQLFKSHADMGHNTGVDNDYQWLSTTASEGDISGPSNLSASHQLILKYRGYVFNTLRYMLYYYRPSLLENILTVLLKVIFELLEITASTGDLNRGNVGIDAAFISNLIRFECSTAPLGLRMGLDASIGNHSKHHLGATDNVRVSRMNHSDATDSEAYSTEQSTIPVHSALNYVSMVDLLSHMSLRFSYIKPQVVKLLYIKLLSEINHNGGGISRDGVSPLPLYMQIYTPPSGLLCTYVYLLQHLVRPQLLEVHNIPSRVVEHGHFNAALEDDADFTRDLIEILQITPKLHPSLATLIISILVPLCSSGNIHNKPLRDNCSMAIRKSSFSNDMFVRMGALSCLFPIIVYNTTNSKIVGGHSIFALDDIFTIYKRTLQQDTMQCKQIVYHSFFKLQNHSPKKFRKIILHILFDQLKMHVKGSLHMDFQRYDAEQCNRMSDMNSDQRTDAGNGLKILIAKCIYVCNGAVIMKERLSELINHLFVCVLMEIQSYRIVYENSGMNAGSQHTQLSNGMESFPFTQLFSQSLEVDVDVSLGCDGVGVKNNMMDTGQNRDDSVDAMFHSGGSSIHFANGWKQDRYTHELVAIIHCLRYTIAALAVTELDCEEYGLGRDGCLIQSFEHACRAQLLVELISACIKVLSLLPEIQYQSMERLSSDISCSRAGSGMQPSISRLACGHDISIAERHIRAKQLKMLFEHCHALQVALQEYQDCVVGMLKAKQNEQRRGRKRKLVGDEGDTGADIGTGLAVSPDACLEMIPTVECKPSFNVFGCYTRYVLCGHLVSQTGSSNAGSGGSNHTHASVNALTNTCTCPLAHLQVDLETSIMLLYNGVHYSHSSTEARERSSKHASDSVNMFRENETSSILPVSDSLLQQYHDCYALDLVGSGSSARVMLYTLLNNIVKVIQQYIMRFVVFNQDSSPCSEATTTTTANIPNQFNDIHGITSASQLQYLFANICICYNLLFIQLMQLHGVGNEQASQPSVITVSQLKSSCIKCMVGCVRLVSVLEALVPSVISGTGAGTPRIVNMVRNSFEYFREFKNQNPKSIDILLRMYTIAMVVEYGTTSDTSCSHTYTGIYTNMGSTQNGKRKTLQPYIVRMIRMFSTLYREEPLHAEITLPGTRPYSNSSALSLVLIGELISNYFKGTIRSTNEDFPDTGLSIHSPSSNAEGDMKVELQRIFDDILEEGIEILGSKPPSANICQTIMVLLLHSCVQNPKVRIEKLQQFSQNIATCCDQVCTNTHPMDTVGIVWIGCCPSAMAYVISQAENACLEVKALLNALQLQSKSKSKAVDIGSVRVQLKDLCSNMISYYTNLITLLCIDYTRLHSTLHSISVNYNRGVEEEDAHYDAATDPVLKDISRFKYIGRQKASLVTELISVEERLVIIFTKILKLQVDILKAYIAFKVKWTDPSLVNCMRYLSTTVFTKIHEYILVRVHGGGNAQTGEGPHVDAQRRRNAGANSMKIQRKNEKLIPSLIYEMEQVDLHLIRLCKMLQDKHLLTCYIKRSSIRDFRIG